MMISMKDLRDALAQSSARLLSLDELAEQSGATEDVERWSLAALRGRLVELSAVGARATMTAAIELVWEAQTEGEPTAWILMPAHGSFFPPDVAASGIDLATLAVVRVPDTLAAARAAERLLRSGAFGLVVIDLGPGRDEARPTRNELTMAHQGRLVTLAQTHDAAIVCLTEKSERAASLGSLVSLRIEAQRSCERDESMLRLRAVKDKRRGPGWSHEIGLHTPDGFARIRRASID